MAVNWHPAHILLQLRDVPDVPDTVICAYDKEAFNLYKEVMKAVRRFFSTDILKYEDFKINSRLVGNNFMEAHEYVDYLAESLGGLRMLLLLPCLVKIQPDPVKRNLLLSAARTYRIRNLTDLKQRCDAECQSKKQAQTPVKQKQYIQHSLNSKDGENEQAQTTPMDRTLHLTHSYETNASNKRVGEHVVSQQKLEMKDDPIQRHAEIKTNPISISKHEVNPSPPRNLFEMASDSCSDSDSDFGSP